MKICRTYLLVLLCIVACGCTRHRTDYNDPQTARIAQVSYWAEGDSQQRVTDARREWTAHQYTNLTSGDINLGRVRKRYWFHITIHAAQDQETLLELSNPFLYRIELYPADSAAVSPSVITGIDFPFDQRPVSYRRFVMPLRVKKGNTEYFLLCDRRAELLRFSMQLLTLERLHEQQNRDYLFFGSVFGILALIAFFSAVLLVLLHDRIYLYYLLYISLMLLFVITDNGIGYQWLWSNMPLLQKYMRNFISLAAFGVHLRFVPLLLNLDVTHKKLCRCMRWISSGSLALLPVFAAGIILEHNSVPMPDALVRTVQLIFYACFIAGLILVLYSSGQKALAGSKTARVYLLATSPLIIQVFIVIFSRWHIIRTDLDTAKYLAVAILIEIVVLGIGLMLRYYQLRKEKENLARALSIQQHANMVTMLGTQEAERKRIAEDLHDHLGGTLSALKGMLSSLPQDDPQLGQQLTHAQSLLDNACYDIRSIAHNLMPANFQNSTLAQALEESIVKFNRNPYIQFQFLVFGTPFYLEKETELHIFRIANELLNNVVKHARATEVTLQLLYHPDMIELMIEDNGTVAFSPHGAGKDQGIGLKSLYSRADCINANLRYDSSSRGTTVICTIPKPEHGFH